MWELDCEESWAPKNWCFWTVVLEKTLESSLDCKEFQPVYSKGNQSWIFIGRTNVSWSWNSNTWPPDVKNWLIEKTLMLGKIEGWRRTGWKRMRWLDSITDSMARSLVGYSPLGCKESYVTELLSTAHNRAYGMYSTTIEEIDKWILKSSNHNRMPGSHFQLSRRSWK